MLVSFELSMPSNNAWNGKWTGEGNCYARVREYDEVPAPDGKGIAPRYFTYSFGDGWMARVDVRVVDQAEADKLAQKSNGFCGYDWMIASIERHGKILA